MGLEPALAALVMLIGVALTVFAVFTHTGQAVAPGALLTMLGGLWLGSSLSRRDIRLLPGSSAIPKKSLDADGTA